MILSDFELLLIQGRQNSGKSDFCFYILKKIIESNKNNWLNDLLDSKEKILLFTERVDQVQLINNGLYNKVFIVENISSKDYFEYLKKYHENSNIEILVIDYINLLNKNFFVFNDFLRYIKENKIKTIFVQNNFKLLMNPLKVDFFVDSIVETSKIDDSIEITIKKENNIEYLEPKIKFLNKKD